MAWRRDIHHTQVVLDDCNFHECVDLSEFEMGRCLNFYPPEGEFAVPPAALLCSK